MNNCLAIIEDGRKTSIDMSQKWSTQIFEELMDAAGGERWKQFKESMNLGLKTVFLVGASS